MKNGNLTISILAVLAAFTFLAPGSSALAQEDSVQNVITEESKEAVLSAGGGL